MWAKCAKIAIEKSHPLSTTSKIFFPRPRHDDQRQKEKEEGDVVFVLVAVLVSKRRRRLLGETSPQQLAVKTTKVAAGANGRLCSLEALSKQQSFRRRDSRILGRRRWSVIATIDSHLHRTCQQTQRASTAEALEALVGPRLMEV